MATVDTADFTLAADHTSAEVATIVRLLQRADAQLVNVGHGRDATSGAVATAFISAWEASGGTIGTVADWPAGSASWLRPAKRLTAGCPDAWVVADRPAGWAQMANRLRRSTDWKPARRVGFHTIANEQLALVASLAVEGLSGAMRDGTVWHVRDRLRGPRECAPRCRACTHFVGRDGCRPAASRA